ncbi:hypothetical protein EYF80_066112 [Liparis tanakae]|uniref:Uncharacterized protein n=1 Tax=Liparis tanakae TaxID=230148 RepID=A0A4Z2E4C2_9TELE|nr:hypothetical protein EYF80_066112 [Liparis tanakae]
MKWTTSMKRAKIRTSWSWPCTPRPPASTGR